MLGLSPKGAFFLEDLSLLVQEASHPRSREGRWGGDQPPTRFSHLPCRCPLDFDANEDGGEDLGQQRGPVGRWETGET